MLPFQKLIPSLYLLAIGLPTFGQSIPLFTPPLTYSAPGATMAVVADVNGDGFPDIVTANGYAGNSVLLGGSGVGLLLGKGDGTFQPFRNITTNGNPTFLATGDFNNDGKIDIAVANGFFTPTPTVSILLGNGDGTFKPAVDIATGGATALAVADFNGDGNLDLVVTNSGGGQRVTVLLGHGDGTFTTSYTTPELTNATMVIATDVNGDGKPDIIFYSPTGAVKIGNGDGTFHDGQANLQGFAGGYINVADFNGDGRVDLAIRYSFAGIAADGGNGICAILLGQPDGTFGPQFFTNFSGGFTNMVTADFNGDGLIDTAGAGGFFQPALGISLGNGDGHFTFNSAGFGARPFDPTPGVIQLPTGFAATGDFDRNGAPDLLVAEGNVVQVALNTGGHPPHLAQVSVFGPSGSAAGFVVGGVTPLTAQVSLGGVAPAGGTTVTLSSSDPNAFFPGGNTVAIPAGSQTVPFSISTSTVIAPTPPTISASSGVVTTTSSFTVVPSFTLSAVSIAPASLFGMFGGNAAVGTATFSGPVADGVVVSLTSGNSAALTVPATVAVAPGASSATFPVTAQTVQADTTFPVSGSFQGITRSGSVTVRKHLATVTVTKAQYIIAKSELDLEATTTDGGTLQVFNAGTGAFICIMNNAGPGKFTAKVGTPGPFTSVIVQSTNGGVAIAAVPQK